MCHTFNCSAGTSVLKITATDADEPGNANSQIAYSIVNQDPSDMFYIKSDGTICVRTPPDREVWTAIALICHFIQSRARSEIFLPAQ